MIDFDKFSYDILWPWLQESGLRIAIIIILAYIIRKLIGLFLEKVVRRLVVSSRFSSKAAEKKREDTIITIVNGTLNVLILLIALLMILEEIGVAIGPLLAAAGIAGLAFGFGGQYLIRDIISGLFIILENQYRVGDVVCFDDTCGLVENISLRMTTLRDLDGTVHHVPHGEVKKVSNLSKGYARVNMDIGISYDSDLEKVEEVVNRVGKDLSEDPEWKDSIIKPPQYLRVDKFADSSIIIKILGETKPMKQWDVAGEMRKRLKTTFDLEGIEIPFPQRVIIHKKDDFPEDISSSEE